MAFTVLNENELALLTDDQRHGYEDELKMYKKRVAFVEQLDYMENVQIEPYSAKIKPVAAIKKAEIKPFAKLKPRDVELPEVSDRISPCPIRNNKTEKAEPQILSAKKLLGVDISFVNLVIQKTKLKQLNRTSTLATPLINPAPVQIQLPRNHTIPLVNSHYNPSQYKNMGLPEPNLTFRSEVVHRKTEEQTINLPKMPQFRTIGISFVQLEQDYTKLLIETRSQMKSGSCFNNSEFGYSYSDKNFPQLLVPKQVINLDITDTKHRPNLPTLKMSGITNQLSFEKIRRNIISLPMMSALICNVDYSGANNAIKTVNNINEPRLKHNLQFEKPEISVEKTHSIPEIKPDAAISKAKYRISIIEARSFYHHPVAKLDFCVTVQDEISLPRVDSYSMRISSFKPINRKKLEINKTVIKTLNIDEYKKTKYVCHSLPEVKQMNKSMFLFEIPDIHVENLPTIAKTHVVSNNYKTHILSESNVVAPKITPHYIIACEKTAFSVQKISRVDISKAPSDFNELRSQLFAAI